MLRRTRGASRLFLTSAALLLSACSSNTPTPTSVGRAVIAVAVDPTPVLAVASTRIGTTFSARFKVVVTEIAGQGGEVQFVRTTLYDELTGLPVGAVNYDTKDLIVFVGEERIEANGKLEVPIQIDYVIPSSATEKAGRLSAVVDLKDDKGNAVSASILVKVE